MPDLETITAKYTGVKICEMTAPELNELFGAVARRGAHDALIAIGLGDELAGADLRDLRDLLKGFRILKRSAWRQLWTTIGRSIGWMLLLAVLMLILRKQDAQMLMRVIGQ